MSHGNESAEAYLKRRCGPDSVQESGPHQANGPLGMVDRGPVRRLDLSLAIPPRIPDFRRDRRSDPLSDSKAQDPGCSSRLTARLIHLLTGGINQSLYSHDLILTPLGAYVVKGDVVKVVVQHGIENILEGPCIEIG